MGGCDHGPTGTPEADAEIALAALAEGDLTHAAHHVAAAVAADPSRASLLALVGRLVEAAGGTAPALELFPMERTWYGAAAVRARLLLGEAPDEALDLLCQVVVVRPDCAVLGWAVDHVDRLDPESAVSSLARLLRLELDPTSDEGRAQWIPALALLEGLLERAPDLEPLATLAAMLTRRAGFLEEAWELATRTWSRFPSWRAAVARANAARATGRWTEAERAWADALRLDPEDLSVRLDWGDALLERGELAAARRKYDEVLAREPEHPWAAPSALYVDWLRFPTVTARQALAGWAEAHGGDPSRGTELADLATPWVGRLPGPFGDDAASYGPSSAPAPRVERAVRALAAVPYHAVRWLSAGADLARAEGVGPDDAPDLERAAARPELLALDPRFDGWGWRTTHAAAFVLAGFPGWEGTPHRAALLALLAGPGIGAPVAASAALAERGRGDPTCWAEVQPRLAAALGDDRDAVAWAAACGLARGGTGPDPDLARAVAVTLRAVEDPEADA